MGEGQWMASRAQAIERANELEVALADATRKLEEAERERDHLLWLLDTGRIDDAIEYADARRWERGEVVTSTSGRVRITRGEEEESDGD